LSAVRTTTRRPELRVVFDSSAIYTGTASDLLRQDLRVLIEANANHRDLAILWYLPEVVVHERQFQMQRKGRDLLPAIQKLEKLLGHSLGIDASILESRVSETVSKQVTEYGLTIRRLAIESVDWNRLLLDATYRRPPFEPGDQEKGFRDAIVAETFFQIIEESPSTPKVCRVILVTQDNLLAQAVETRAAGQPNVYVLRSLEELAGLINTLASTVDEEFISRLRGPGSELFFTQGQQDTVFYKEQVKKKLSEKFADQLKSLPAGADARHNGTWFISKVEFQNKSGQRINWISRVTVEVKAVKFESPATESSQFGLGDIGASGATSVPGLIFTSTGEKLPVASTATTIPGGLWSTGSTILTGGTLGGESVLSNLSWKRLERIVATGKTIFDVAWSVSVSTTGRLSRPRIEDLKFVETVWSS